MLDKTNRRFNAQVCAESLELCLEFLESTDVEGPLDANDPDTLALLEAVATLRGDFDEYEHANPDFYHREC